jgi:hypothetical protein
MLKTKTPPPKTPPIPFQPHRLDMAYGRTYQQISRRHIYFADSDQECELTIEYPVDCNLLCGVVSICGFSIFIAFLRSQYREI